MSWPETVRKEDFDITYYRGSGPGGQRKNKVSTAVRMVHRPTGTVVKAEEHSMQGQNKKAAFKRMTAILVPLMKEAAQPEREPPVLDRIRTYHQPRQKVKDHRTGKSYSYKEVVEGNGLDKILEDLIGVE